MARMHSRDRGKAGSTKPSNPAKKPWVELDASEIELLVAKLYKQDLLPSQIGLILRDSYGIPDVSLVTNKSVTQILKDQKLQMELPEDLLSLIRRAALLRKHMDKHHTDKGAKRGLQLTESKIRRLMKYYKRNEVIPISWKYEPERAQMYLN